MDDDRYHSGQQQQNEQDDHFYQFWNVNNSEADQQDHMAHEFPVDQLTQSQVLILDSCIAMAVPPPPSPPPPPPTFDLPAYATTTFDDRLHTLGTTFDQLVASVTSTSTSTMVSASSSSAVTPAALASNGVPALDDWPGGLHFTADFVKSQDKTKATPWIYSEKLKKLFVSLDKACPINFSMFGLTPALYRAYRIRGRIFYSRPEDFAERVERCINHQRSDLATSPENELIQHVLRCDASNAIYEELGHRSVVVPLEAPPERVGTAMVTLCFRFMCRSSCIGSLNRRPTTLVFTLESTDTGQVMGRRAVNVRICSCPGRDIKAEEDRLMPPVIQDLWESPFQVPVQLYPPKGKTKKRKLTVALPPEFVPPAATAETSNDPDDDAVYVIQVRGRRNYETALAMVDALMQRLAIANPQPANPRLSPDSPANERSGNPLPPAPNASLHYADMQFPDLPIRYFKEEEDE